MFSQPGSWPSRCRWLRTIGQLLHIPPDDIQRAETSFQLVVCQSGDPTAWGVWTVRDVGCVEACRPAIWETAVAVYPGFQGVDVGQWIEDVGS